MNAAHPEPRKAAAGSIKPWEHAKGGTGSGGDPAAARFVESLSYDRRLYRHDIAGSLAHARMLNEVGLITPDDLSAIERGLAEIQGEIEAAGPDYGAAWPGWRLELEDVHMCIEAALIEKIGDRGKKLHTGRSRNDQVATDLKLWIAEAAAELDGQLRALCSALVELAKRDGQVVMPSYTHLQRAQPIVAGGELLAWVAAFDRARHRVAALQSINQDCPLGSGAVAGTGLPIDRDHTAKALGMAGPSLNSIDATASRDAGIDLVYALSLVGMTLSRWAEQWIIYATTEYGFITLGQAYTTGSSMMPQKANPDMLELIRGRAGGAYGELMALLTICKGLTIGYNRDLQLDKLHIFHAFDGVMASVDMATRVVGSAKFNKERIESGLESGFLDATSLAEYLVTRGVPFRSAHQVVGGLVHHCQDNGIKQLSDLELDVINAACVKVGVGAVCEPGFEKWLGAAEVVKRYQSENNAGVSGLKQQLEHWERHLNGVG